MSIIAFVYALLLLGLLQLGVWAMLAVCVIAFLAYFIAEILERKRRKPE